MQNTPAPDIKEVFTKVLHEQGNKRFCLRVIEYVNLQGVTVRKFGISEFWHCEGLDRWLPAKTHHVFLPIHIWPMLTSNSKEIEDFIAPPTTIPKGTATLKNDVGHSGTSGKSNIRVIDGTGNDSKRRRGRPPKHADGATTSGTATGAVTTTGGTQSAKPAIIKKVKHVGSGGGIKEKEGEVLGRQAAFDSAVAGVDFEDGWDGDTDE